MDINYAKLDWIATNFPHSCDSNTGDKTERCVACQSAVAVNNISEHVDREWKAIEKMIAASS